MIVLAFLLAASLINGGTENHIQISGVKPLSLTKIVVTNDTGAKWELPYVSGNSIRGDRNGYGPIVDLYISPIPSSSYIVTFTYSDGSQEVLSLPIVQAPPPNGDCMLLHDGQTLSITPVNGNYIVSCSVQ